MEVLELFLALIGVAVGVGTPVGTYLATVRGHQVAAHNAQLASDTSLTAAREGAESTERIAAEARASAEERNRQDAVWRAIEYVNADNARSQKLGMDLLTAMLEAGTLDVTHQLVARATLSGVTAPALAIERSPTDVVAEAAGQGDPETVRNIGAGEENS